MRLWRTLQYENIYLQSGIFLTQLAVFLINVADHALPREILTFLGLLHPIGDGV